MTLLAVVAVAFVLVLAVFSGPSWGLLNVLHRAPAVATAPRGLTVSAVYLSIAYPTGSAGVLGAANQSTCGQCPVRFDVADPCHAPVEVIGTILVRNTDSNPHTVYGVSTSTLVHGSNDTWGVSLWNQSGSPMLGPYSLSPGALLPFDVLNVTLNGGCGAVEGTAVVSLNLEWM